MALYRQFPPVIECAVAALIHEFVKSRYLFEIMRL